MPWKLLYERASGLAKTKYEDPFARRLVPLWSGLLMRGDAQDFVLKELTFKLKQVKHAKEPASEKVTACAEFSRLVFNFSEKDAQALFEQAVAFSQEIDLEAFDQIGTLASLSKHSSSWDVEECGKRARQAADVFTEIAERLRDQEYFPWEGCIQAVARLNPPTALAVVSRWSDQGIHPTQILLAFGSAPARLSPH
jgi:hypothetical protein